MENALAQAVTGQGIWAVLSVFLIFFIIKYFKDDKAETQKIHAGREERLLEQLKEFSECLNALSVCYTEVRTDVKEIKQDVEFLKGDRK